MMHLDGIETYLFVQHFFDAEGARERWATTSLAHMLFDPLTYYEARGEIGNRYRALIEPQSASSPLWQRTGIHGYLANPDGYEAARQVLVALRERQPRHRFRLARRTVSQTTVILKD
jgi:hypothetical protein